MTYLKGNTPIHRCDARVKIALLLAYSIAIFFVGSWWVMLAFAAAAIVAIAVARIPFGTLNRMLVPVYVLAGFSVLFNILAAPVVDGLVAGLFLAARMVLLTAVSFVVCLTSSSSDLLEAFRWFIGPLRHLRVPVDDIAFTLSLAIRFILLVEQEFESVRMAQKARGADSVRSFRKRLGVMGQAFATMFVNLFRQADRMADAMDARCYGSAPVRTRLPKVDSDVA